MKKILTLIITIITLLFLTSCTNEKDIFEFDYNPKSFLNF